MIDVKVKSALGHLSGKAMEWPLGHGTFGQTTYGEPLPYKVKMGGFPNPHRVWRDDAGECYIIANHEKWTVEGLPEHA